MERKIIPFIVFIFVLNITALKAQNFYWVGFSDKNNTTYSLSNPGQYLSERAIQRRVNQNIPIDSLDLPVSPDYISQIVKSGITLIHSSKWLNGITVCVEIDSFEQQVLRLPFVTEVQLTKRENQQKSVFNKFSESDVLSNNSSIDTSWYGTSVYQAGLLNGQYLHQKNFLGKGIQIAVLDGGFYNVDSYPAFDSLWINNRILGIHDFVNDSSDFFQTNYHGMSVLSCMGGFVSGELVGTAPEASYWLLRSEDTGSENIIEEDNWVAAAEFADSVGADIINSSLGYSEFDDTTANHTYADMDGKTTRVTRAANIAASRGILVVNSAGNEGNKKWKYIVAPSDGDNVIAVGATDSEGVAAYFSSLGPASDGDIKPNLASMGLNDYLVRSDGNLGYNNGTSFASPVLAGAAACLWQANPNATAAEIKNALERSAHLYETPDSLLGFGIPNMEIAQQILNPSPVEKLIENNNWQVRPNPFYDKLYLLNMDNFGEDVLFSFYSVDGRLLYQEKMKSASQISFDNLQSLPTGLLILKVDTGNGTQSVKLSKTH